jgi:hypothetical protein
MLHFIGHYLKLAFIAFVITSVIVSIVPSNICNSHQGFVKCDSISLSVDGYIPEFKIRYIDVLDLL